MTEEPQLKKGEVNLGVSLFCVLGSNSFGSKWKLCEITAFVLLTHRRPLWLLLSLTVSLWALTLVPPQAPTLVISFRYYSYMILDTFARYQRVGCLLLRLLMDNSQPCDGQADACA